MRNIVDLSDYRRAQNLNEDCKIEFPSSKNFREAQLDPLEELLNEGEVLIEEKQQLSPSNQSSELVAHYHDDFFQILNKVQTQLEQLKQNSRKLSYYLNQLN